MRIVIVLFGFLPRGAAARQARQWPIDPDAPLLIHVSESSARISDNADWEFAMRLRRTIAMPIAAVVAAIAVLSAAAEGDQDLARHALENREVRPLAEILSGLRDRLGGELVGIELERKGGTWVYEFKIVGPAGRKSKIFVDGKTGQIIGPEGD